MAEEHPGIRDLLLRLFVGRGSVVRRTFFQFAFRSIRALAMAPDLRGAPVPRLALRVGIAGRVELPGRNELEPIVDHVLSSLRDSLAGAAEPYGKYIQPQSHEHQSHAAPVCRLVTQLAAGADQFVAHRALKLGYELQCPLPIALDLYAEDLRRNPGADADPAGELMRLKDKARLLEMDGEVEPSGLRLTARSYANAALTLLDHADILLALVQSDAPSVMGGTRWLTEEADRRGMPVIEIALGKIGRSHLRMERAGLRSETPLDAPKWAEGLVNSLVLPPPGTVPFPPSGEFERRFRRLARANESEWPANWMDAERFAAKDSRVKGWIHDIRSAYFTFWHWAEHRANTYRDLYQGAYLSVALLGLTAVTGALAGALHRPWSIPGKWVELGALVVLLIIWRAAHHRKWQQRWLTYRSLEQQISHAAVLELVGRTIPSITSPTLSEFQKQGAWADWYLRSVLRQSNLPKGRLDQKSVDIFVRALHRADTVPAGGAAAALGVRCRDFFSGYGCDARGDSCTGRVCPT